MEKINDYRGIGNWIMKIMDFHWHLVLDQHDAVQVMDRHGIEKVVAMPLYFGTMTWEDIIARSGMEVKDGIYMQNVLHNLWSVNRMMGNKLRDEPRILFVTWESASPAVDASFLPVSDAIGIAFIPPLDNVTVSYYYDMIRRINKLAQRIIMIHTGWGSIIEPLLKVIDTFPDRTFILKHMKEDNDNYNDIRKHVLKTRKNVYVETSYCPHPKRIEQYVKMGFGDKLLFGSDFRTLDDESTLAYFIKMIEMARIPDPVKEDILYNNAKALLDG